jgi:hypothetical protein
LVCFAKSPLRLGAYDLQAQYPFRPPQTSGRSVAVAIPPVPRAMPRGTEASTAGERRPLSRDTTSSPPRRDALRRHRQRSERSPRDTTSSPSHRDALHQSRSPRGTRSSGPPPRRSRSPRRSVAELTAELAEVEAELCRDKRRLLVLRCRREARSPC